MYGIALSVAACLRAGTRVDVAWIVETEAFAGRDRSEAVAITPGGGRIGSLLSGALDGQLADLAGRSTGGGRLVELYVSDVDALIAGLPNGGGVRCLVVPAEELPVELWDLLTVREPVCLVTRIDGDEVVGTSLFTSETIAGAGDDVGRRFDQKVSDAVVSDDRVVTVLWPVPRLVIVGAGPIPDALAEAAALLGWQPQILTDAGTATGVIAGLAALDKLVVAGHDLELTGRALAAALSSAVGYIGALGSRRIQDSRADWLAYRGITDLRRIHGPAGLDIGADTPAKIAVSILAEAVAVESGSGAGSRREPAGSGQH